MKIPRFNAFRIKNKNDALTDYLLLTSRLHRTSFSPCSPESHQMAHQVPIGSAFVDITASAAKRVNVSTQQVL